MDIKISRSSKKKTPNGRPPRDSYVFYIAGSPFLEKPYHFKAVGLPNVYLRNGVHIEDHPTYGRLVSIENMEGLLGAIGIKILERRKGFSGAEFRFLRNQMKMTQVELGKRLQVSDQTIANYEKEKTAPAIATVSMRLLYLLHILPPETPTHFVTELLALAGDIGIRLPDTNKFRIGHGWQDAA